MSVAKHIVDACITYCTKGENPECEADAIRTAAAWMTPEELRQFAILVSREGFWVASNACSQGTLSPQALLDSYGIISDGAWDNVYDDPARGKKAPPYGDWNRMIVWMTKTYPSWGEWLGGVVSHFASFPEELQRDVRDVLMGSIGWAARNGVDH